MLAHTACNKLEKRGTPVGLAISALWNNCRIIVLLPIFGKNDRFSISFSLNKRPPGLIAPLLKFCNLLGNPPINTTKGRDLIFKWRHQAVKHGWQYLALFTYIYPHLPLICPNLVIFTLNCPNLPIYAMFTLHIYSSSKTAPLCKMLKQSENESWRITHLAIGSQIWSLFAPIHMKSWPKVKLGKVQIGSNVAQNHSSSPWEVIYGDYLPQFTWKVDQKWN